ncbi:MAG: LysR family transcriptional regulator [Proteobacteria bacterium]|nr:LysR family transcriptional regulator [Pseudomonadota bacterium]
MSRWEGFEELVEVVNSGSFSAAARVLGVSKSHVSQQVSRLEDRLNTRLLHRTTRKLSLTETGALYYEQARQVVEDLESAEQAVSYFQQEIKGELRIAAPHLIGEALMVPALAQFLEQHPGLDIELLLSGQRVDLVDERFDLAIQVGARKDINVVNKLLAPTSFHVVGSPAYLLRHAPPQTPEDLKQHQCLLFMDTGSTRPWRFQGDKGSVSMSIKSHWRSNSGHALRSAAEQGLGLAYLPDYYLQHSLVDESLVTLLNDWQSPDREIVAIYQHKRHLSTKIRVFTEFLKEFFTRELQLLRHV